MLSTHGPEKCVLCGLNNVVMKTLIVPGVQSSLTFECRRCGEYTLSIELRSAFNIPPNPYLWAATRQASEKGSPLVLTRSNWEDLARVHEATAVSERIEKLLNAIARGSGRPGKPFDVNYQCDFPLADAGDWSELKLYLDHLYERKLIDMVAAQESAKVTLTVGGWEFVQPRIAIGGVPGTCFVAMWFDASVQDAYELGFSPGIRDAGFKPIRIDQKLTNKGISDEIKAEIRMAQFTVADFTGQRQSVYYEAGFANGLGREVIWCCRQDEVNNLHFDIRHFGHVVWKDPADLRLKLARSIQANIVPKR